MAQILKEERKQIPEINKHWRQSRRERVQERGRGHARTGEEREGETIGFLYGCPLSFRVRRR